MNFNGTHLISHNPCCISKQCLLLLALEDLVQPRHRDPVGSMKISHGRILPRLAHPDHGLVVLVRQEDGLVGKKNVP